MTRQASEMPSGYVGIQQSDAEIVVLKSMARPVCEALVNGSLYEYASRHPEARAYQGRGLAYGVQLPNCAARVVIRRSRHGGFLRAITGERFLRGTRAPRELAASVRLTRAGVPTPQIIAYVTYPAGGPFRRADVVTREVVGASDLGALLTNELKAVVKDGLLREVGSLLVKLTQVGAHHPDLNVKNILMVSGESDAREAWLLDVDRVWFDEPGDRRVGAANVRRLTRSLRKWRQSHGISVDESDIARLVSRVHGDS